MMMRMPWACLYGSQSIVLMPAACIFCAAVFSARVIGGCGRAMPSSQSIPTVNSLVGVVCFQGSGTTADSSCHGSPSMMAFMTRSRSRRELAKGPSVHRVLSCPGPASPTAFQGVRNVVGRIPNVPQKAAGRRMEPPISLPIPMGAHRNPIDAPSPPEEPPGERRMLWGLRVRP